MLGYSSSIQPDLPWLQLSICLNCQAAEVVIILWINHVMSCTWFYVGRITSGGDTGPGRVQITTQRPQLMAGASWLDDSIKDENSPPYYDTLPWLGVLKIRRENEAI